MSTTLAIRDRLLDELGDAQQKRPVLGELVQTEHDRYPMPRWVVHEREVMLAGVARERAERGLPAPTMAEIVRVESFASGHIDYSRKFALYCAELAVAERMPTP